MLFGLFLLISCTDQSTNSTSSTAIDHSPNKTSEQPQEQPRIIILGDSITAGLGLPSDGIYPTLLADHFQRAGTPTEILNAGVSGDTTAGGLRRIDWLLKQQPDLLLIELGANDGMRGVPLEDIEANLSKMIEKSQQADVAVRLLQMRIPANFGDEYTAGFAAIYPRLAEKHDVPLLPFLLQGVAGDQELNQADGIHPTKAGHSIIAETMFMQLEEWRADWKP